MENSNLIILLSSFSVYEMNKFHKFVISPYFNKSESIIRFFERLKIDLAKNQLQEKPDYFEIVFDSKEYDDQKFRNLVSDLFHLGLQFLAQEEFAEDNRYKANKLLTSVGNRELKKLFDKAISTSQKWTKKSELRDGNFFLNSFNIEKNILNLESEFDIKTRSKKGSVEEDILRINDNLDYFYMIEKLKYYNTYLSYKKIFKSTQDFPYVDKVLAIIKMHEKDLPVALRIYYEIYKTSVNPEDIKSYHNLKVLVKRYYHLFDEKDAKNMFESLVNFTIKQINNGNTSFHEEFLTVYEEGIINGVILDKGKLSPTSFRNVVTIAARSKKFDWTTKFIEKNINLIDLKHRDNAYQYNLAIVYFYSKDYKKVIEVLREVEFEDPLYANMSKTMVMVSYCELFDDEALFYFADSFSMYLRRSKNLSDFRKREFQNLIKFIKKLSKGRYDPSILPKLKEDVMNTKELASKQWLLDKLENVKLPNEK